MKQSISVDCPKCKKYVQLELNKENSFFCPECSAVFSSLSKEDKAYNPCPVCGCRQFYIQKDFNQALGCVIMGVGIILVPFTYGLSLPVFAFIDWLLFRRYPTIIACYRCGAEFRGFKHYAHLKPFMHHIGLKYDKYR